MTFSKSPTSTVFLALPFFALWWALRSMARWALTDISSLLSSPSPCSTSPSKSLLSHALALLPWLGAGVVGIFFALAGFFADGLSEDGWRFHNIMLTQLGADLFPYNRFIRTRPGYFAMAYVVPSEASISMISNALRTDPFAADLTLGLAQHYAAVGNPDMSAIVLDKFHRLAPNSKRDIVR
jgi:hypothetical protein